ncbi:MAG: hypothetical protein AABY51_09240 [Deltaproteobacteria bacterium]
MDKTTLDQRHRFYEKLSQKSTRFLLSPVNVLEILCIEDELRRESIISLLQNICDRSMLAEVEALIIDFIAEKTVNSNLQNFCLDTQFCNSNFSHTWQDIFDNKLKTFVFDANALKQFSVLKQVMALLHAHFARGGSLTDLDVSGCDLRKVHQDKFFDEIKRQVAKRRALPVETPRTVKVIDHVYLLIAIILCAGLTPFFEPIASLWYVLGVKEITQRIDYSFRHFDFLYKEGVFIGMGALMGWQATRAYSNGNLFDCYHISYLPYIDEFLTLDSGLLEFAQTYSYIQDFQKIHSAESLLQDALQS